MVNARSKGQRGEREAIKVLQPIVDSVLGEGVAELERNLDQWRSGGFDIHGLEWMALEVKRQESKNLDSWWRQTVKQAGEDRVPVLMWRQNNNPWRFRVRTNVVTGGWSIGPLDVDMERGPFEVWFRHLIWWHSQKVDLGA